MTSTPLAPFPSTTEPSGPGATLTMVGALYLAQGIPLGLAFDALPVILRDQGVSLDLLAFLPLVGLPWILKFLWAPLVDNHGLGRMGRRKGWVLITQTLTLLCLVALAALPGRVLADSPVGVLALGLACLGILAAATQDTATDGLAAEYLRGSSVAWANALQVGGMMAGYLMGGAGTLVVVDILGEPAALLVLGAILLATQIPVWRWREGDTPASPRARARLIETFRRPVIWPLLVVTLSQGLLYAGAFALAKLSLTDAGWSLSRVGLASLVGGLAVLALGAPLGSWLTNRLGVWRAFALGMALIAAALIGWLTLVDGAVNGVGDTLPLAMVALLGLGGGVSSATTFTLIMRFAGTGHQAGTDATIPQSASVLGEMLAAGLFVGLAGAAGYAVSLQVKLAAILVAVVISTLAARRRTLDGLTHPTSPSDRGLADRITDAIARRPSGWLGRRLYREARFHREGFDLALATVPLGPADHVLDVGSGGGAFLGRILATGARAAGLDHSPDMVRAARNRNAMAVAGGRADIRQGDASALPFPDGAFTHVFCLNAFFFFPAPRDSIAEMARVLAPGGRLTILTVSPDREPVMRRIFGPIARRMRFDPPDDLAGWARAANLVVEGHRPAPAGGYLFLARGRESPSVDPSLVEDEGRLEPIERA
jgi:RhtX/FptX family siderophore transporter